MEAQTFAGRVWDSRAGDTALTISEFLERQAVYIPLRIEPEWAGTVRPCYMPRAAFERKFEYVGEGLPI
jgi:hypothetical protein